MEGEINFCPYCDAAQHKIMLCRGNLYHCKECNRFFEHRKLDLKCPRCDKTQISKSDFPSPAGEAVFQCRSCKKMFSAGQFFEENGIA